MSRGACALTCKGCRQVARLVGELRDLRQMMDSMNRMITGQGLEEESGETGDQVAIREKTEENEKREPVMTPGSILTEESRKRKETAERSSQDDRGTDIEMEGEHGTEEEETGRQLLDGKGLRPGTQMLATHSYKKNPNGPVGNELDLEEGDTLVYLMEHEDNVERGSSVVECRTRNLVSPGSNPPLLPFGRLGIFLLSIDVPVDSAV